VHLRAAAAASLQKKNSISAPQHEAGTQVMFLSATRTRRGGVGRVVAWLQTEAAKRFKSAGALVMISGMPNVSPLLHLVRALIKHRERAAVSSLVLRLHQPFRCSLPLPLFRKVGKSTLINAFAAAAVVEAGRGGGRRKSSLSVGSGGGAWGVRVPARSRGSAKHLAKVNGARGAAAHWCCSLVLLTGAARCCRSLLLLAAAARCCCFHYHHHAAVTCVCPFSLLLFFYRTGWRPARSDAAAVQRPRERGAAGAAAGHAGAHGAAH